MNTLAFALVSALFLGLGAAPAAHASGDPLLDHHCSYTFRYGPRDVVTAPVRSGSFDLKEDSSVAGATFFISARYQQGTGIVTIRTSIVDNGTGQETATTSWTTTSLTRANFTLREQVAPAKRWVYVNCP